MGIAVKSQSQHEMPLGMMEGEMRVPSDQAKKKEEHLNEMGMSGMAKVVPVDLYGKRTMYPKGTDLQEVIADVNKVQGLE